jgi:hypothetical protein
MSTTTLDKFVTKRQSIQSQIDDLRLIPMNLSNISKNGNRFNYQDSELAPSSLKSLLGVLGVKESLVNEIKDDSTQWGPLHDALSNIKENKVVTAVLNRRNNSISKVFNHGIKEEKPIDLTNGLRYTEEFLKNTEANLELQDFNFDPNNICININFKSPDSDIDVFGDGKDMWKAGFGMQFHLNKFITSPFFLRLVCSNGMVAAHRMAQRFVNSDELTQRTFDKQVLKYTGPASGMEEVQTYCRRLRDNNASLREFYSARDRVSAIDKDLANEYFPENEIVGRYKMIGLDVNRQNRRWMATANSNVNSYDLFNNLTNIASHRLVSDEDIATRMEINRLASEMFFNGPDFKSMAPDPFKMVMPANLEA